MSLIPTTTELKRFGSQHPILSLLYITMLGFTAVDVMSSFTLPKGKGPFSTRQGLLPGVTDIADLGGSTSTSTSTSTSHPPHIVRERLMRHGTYGELSGAPKHFHSFSEPVKDHWGKYPGGETIGTEGYTHAHLGGSTSTTTSTSSTHLPPGLRRRLLSRTLETEVSGSHLGKQTLSTQDRMKESGNNEFDAMFGLHGLTPEVGAGWTE